MSQNQAVVHLAHFNEHKNKITQQLTLSQQTRHDRTGLIPS